MPVSGSRRFFSLLASTGVRVWVSEFQPSLEMGKSLSREDRSRAHENFGVANAILALSAQSSPLRKPGHQEPTFQFLPNSIYADFDSGILQGHMRFL